MLTLSYKITVIGLEIILREGRNPCLVRLIASGADYLLPPVLQSQDSSREEVMR